MENKAIVSYCERYEQDNDRMSVIHIQSEAERTLLMHVTERQRKLVEELSKPAVVLRTAMMNAGYTEYTANNGMASIPKRVLQLIARKGVKFVELGKMDAATQEQLVRGRLVYNTIQGKDSGVMSAKALGSDRRVNMFTPETQVGVVLVQTSESKSINAIDSED